MGVELEGGKVSVDAALDGVEFGVGSGLDNAALVDDEDAASRTTCSPTASPAWIGRGLNRDRLAPVG